MTDKKEISDDELAAAMDTAVDEAVSAVSTTAAPPTADEIKAARARAEELVSDPGMKDLQNLTMTVGLPAARALLRQLIGATIAPDSVKKSMFKTIDKLSPLSEPGCMEVNFFNKETKAADKVYFELDVCHADHDLSKELDKIRPLVAPEKWKDVLQALSVLVGLGSSVYAKLVKDNPKLMEKIKAHLSDQDKNLILGALSIDRGNTTLFVIDRLPSRVGIHVRRAPDKS